MGWFLLGLILVAIPFVLPIVGWVSGRRARQRIAVLEGVVLQQAEELDRVTARLDLLERRPVAPPSSARDAPVPTPPEAAWPPLESPVDSAPAVDTERWQPAASAAEQAHPPETAPSPATPAAVSEVPTPELPGLPAPAEPDDQGPGVGVPAGRPDVPVPPPISTRPAAPAFDWESLIGVRLFAAVAGIALVLAAVLFLKHSIDQG